MPYLSNIKHVDKNVEEKVNFFIDYFKFSNKRLGYTFQFRFDSPESLLENILWQLQCNFDNAKVYITNYLNQFNDFDIEIIAKLVGNSKKLNLFKGLLNLSKPYSEIKSNKRKYIKLFKELVSEVGEKQLKENVHSITGILSCKHKLVTHKKELEYRIANLVSTFRFREFSHKEANDALRNIFFKDEYKFPFPIEIEKISSKKARKIAKQKFLEERNFIDQFDGISNTFSKSKQKIIFLFKVENFNFELNTTKRFIYNDVSFQNPKINKFDSFRREGESRELIRLFFNNDKPFLVAETKVECRSEVEGRLMALSRIEEAIQHINYRMNIDNPKLDKNHYLTTKNFSNCDAGKFFHPTVYYLTERDLKKLKSNLYSQLRFVNKSLKNKLIFFEDKYQKGIRDNNISLLWEYLENVIPLNNDGKKQVKSIATSIICIKLKDHLLSCYREDFINAISMFSPGARNFLPGEERNKLRRRKYDKINVYESTKNTNHKFMYLLGRLYKDSFSRRFMKLHFDYVFSILTEAYEYRNMKVHRGVVNQNLRIKIESTFIQFVYLFRVQCIIILNKHKSERNFDKLILKTSNKEMKKYKK